MGYGITSRSICFALFLLWSGVVSCAQDNTAAPVDKSAVEYNPAYTDDRGKFISDGRWACMWVFNGEPTFSAEAQRLSFLLDEEVQAEIELSDSQRKKLEPLLKAYRSATDKVLETILQRHRVSPEEKTQLTKQLLEMDAQFQEEFTDVLGEILTAGQIELLERIYLNYQLAGRGLVQPIQLAIEKGQLDSRITECLPALAKQQEAMALELRLRCQKFIEAEFERLKPILDEAQWEGFTREREEAMTRRYPSLIVAMTEIALEDHERRKPIDALGQLTVFDVQPGGSLKERSQFAVERISMYTMEIDIRRAAKTLELSDVQVAQIEQLDQDRMEWTKSLAAQYTSRTDGSLEDPKGYRQASEELHERYLKRFDQILVPAQYEMLERSWVPIQVEKFGLISCLLNGWLSRHLDIRESQKQQIRDAYGSLRERYRQFSRESMEWLWEEVQRVVDDPQLSRQIRETFELEFRTVSLPIGALAQSLAGKQVFERVGSRELYQRPEESSQSRGNSLEPK